MITVVGQIILDLALLGYLAVQMRVRFQSPFWRTIRLAASGNVAHTTPRAFAYLGLVFGGLALSLLVSQADSLFVPKRPFARSKPFSTTSMPRFYSC